jgi:protein-S-isoprenylcysteine O-methyltransferase Ste14
MNWQLIKAILILPGTALVYVPALLLWLVHGTGLAAHWATPADPRFWLALAVAAPGLTLMVWTGILFTRFGRGTPAPWAPPKRLVIRGPYCHVRNPMISGVLTVQLAEALLSGAWPIAGWLLVFLAANALYFPLVEEKGLEARFGQPYLDYKAAVPRWIPRLHPWSPAPDKD